MRAFVGRATRRHYGLTKWRIRRRMARGPDASVVVFSMGKTAGTAVTRAVERVVTGPVFHIHHLVPESIDRAEAEYRRTDPSARPVHVWQAQHLAARLPTPASPWTVVTVVREPVARAASEFFQSGRRLGRLGDDASIREPFVDFVERRVERTLEWFDAEFGAALDLDVYAHPFDPDRGWAVVDTPAIRLLVLRQESLDAAPEALGRFLGIGHDVEIGPANLAADKRYAAQYRRLVAELHFPSRTLDVIYGSRYARHFYGPDEIERFREHWESNEHRP